MRCPSCGATDRLAVKETRRTAEGTIRRRRRCPSCGSDFTTVEQVSGDLIVVRKSDGASEPFDRGKLRKGIVKAAVRPHHSDRLSELVESIAQDARHSAADGIVESRVIADIVLTHLKEFDPVTHVRYALTQLGRRDGKRSGEGWADADDVREWLRSSYPEIEHFRPSTKLAKVIKRDGRREPYDRKKLERSIGVASKGRGTSDEGVRDLATRLSEVVERSLRDQSMVTSGQIASEILRSLRQEDQIAAIRFASTAKGFVSVEDYETEALGFR